VLLDQTRRGQDDLLDRLVITHITRATTDVIIQGVGDVGFDLISRDGFSLQSLDENSGGIDKARRTVAALEAIKVEKFLLHRRECRDQAIAIALRMAFDGAQFAAVEITDPGNACTYFLALPVLAIEYDDTGAANALSATQARTGQMRVLMKKIDHHQ